VWVCGCTGVRVCGCAGVRVCGCAGVRVCGWMWGCDGAELVGSYHSVSLTIVPSSSIIGRAYSFRDKDDSTTDTLENAIAKPA